MQAKARLHVREFLADALTPVAVYDRLAELSPVRFLFESVTGGEQVSRYSFLGAAPRQLVELDELGLKVDGVTTAAGKESIDRLREILGRIEGAPNELPFSGGYVGYFGFDLVRHIEELPDRPPDGFGLPAAMLGRFDHMVVFDHARQRVLAVANEVEGEVSREEALRDLDSLSALLETPMGAGAAVVPEELPAAGELLASLDDESYRNAVARAREYIAAGDIFQVVLARHFELEREGVSPRQLYRALRAVNPSPYMVLLEFDEMALVGASPEMLIRKSGGRIETRPIAGTRPRGRDAETDLALAAELAADEKERAEHVMLVDLGRNDLGKVAKAGSVSVPSFMEIEKYSHVMHLVSSVEGDLEDGCSALDALLACFPAGTVSGAPKIRAIEIIDELEPAARGPYAGAVGYLSFGGDLDTCITIRTLLIQGDKISVTAGAGIVADSDPAREEQETRDKAAAMFTAIELARGLGPEPMRGGRSE